MKIALYRTIDGSQLVLAVSDYVEGSDNYLRISEVAEVDFTMLNIEPEFEHLKEEERNALCEYVEKVNAINRKRKELRGVAT
jgi:hypothetical protein